MTLQQTLEQFNEIRRRYPTGATPIEMEPNDAARFLQLKRQIERQARTNQGQMTALLYEVDEQSGDPQPALFDHREVYEILSPDFEEEGEGVGARIERTGGETYVTIDPILLDPDTGLAREHPGYLGGITLTFAEVVHLLEEFGPLAYDQHPCARCGGSAAPGRDLCPRCERDAAAFREVETIKQEGVRFLQ